MSGMTNGEILRLVNGYIGVSGGYLGDFSYRSHQEFYSFLDLDIDPYDLDGTTRERFITILKSSDPQTQATIIEGILDKYPVGSEDIRTAKRHAEFETIAMRLRGAPSVGSMHPQTSSDLSLIHI